jgi:DNA topoisomerase-2
LDTLLENNEIIDYKNCSDDSIINFKISLQKCVIDELISKGMIEKTFKLTSVINTSNMHVFDTECKIAKMSCPEEIIYHFYKKRTSHFQKRKKYLINKLTSESELLESKIKFINYVINEKIVVFNKKKDYIISEIKKMGDMIQVNDSWDYLLDLKIWTFTEEKINQLNNSLNELLVGLKKIKKLSIEEMWTSELDQLN